jgi:hypothetical protein
MGLVQLQFPVWQPWLRRERLHCGQTASGIGMVQTQLPVCQPWLRRDRLNYTLDKLLQVLPGSTSTSSLSALAH